MFGDGPKSWLSLGWRHWRRIATFFAALFICWAAIIGFHRYQQSIIPQGPPGTSTSTIATQQRPETFMASDTYRSSYLHMLFPATKGGDEFCQGIFSAAALDYPTPRIHTWGGTDDSFVARIKEISNYLNNHGPENDDSLVIIADPKAVWFQLRPSVLIERFHAINERARVKTRESLGPGFDQRIVFSAQATCSSPDKATCHSASDSIVAPTTAATGSSVHLNSATIVGWLGNLRALFQHAVLLIEKQDDHALKSDHELFAHIFGQQEHQRLATLKGNNGEKGKKKKKPTGSEFRMGLDYFGEISQPTVKSSRELSWVVFNESSSAFSSSSPSSQSQSQPKANNNNNNNIPLLASDIIHSTPPFWNADLTGATRLVPEHLPWSAVPLLTNLDRSSSSPVSPPIIHHSAHRDDDTESHIRLDWSKIYFHPHLRALLRTKANAFRMPAAVITESQQQQQQQQREEWWGPIDERGFVFLDHGLEEGGVVGWAEWEEVCGSQDVADEVFGSDEGGREGAGGPWVNPIYYLPWGKDQEKFEEWEARGGESFMGW